MGDGKALQMGTSHELGRTSPGPSTSPTPTRPASAGTWQTSWGVSTRRSGALSWPTATTPDSACPLCWPPPRWWSCSCGPRREPGRRPPPSPGAGRTGLQGRPRRPGRHRLRAAQRRLGGRSRAPRGGSSRPGRGPGHAGPAGHRHQGARARGEVTAGWSPPSTTPQRSLLEVARERCDGRTTDVSTLEEAAEAASSGFARLPWASGGGGRGSPAEMGMPSAVLRRPDGVLPEGQDDLDLVAVVGRAY